jgi:hypothetical protein
MTTNSETNEKPRQQRAKTKKREITKATRGEDNLRVEG